MQSTKKIHIDVVQLKNGNAYKCYCSNEEIEEQKELNKKIPYIYNRIWRDKKEAEAPKNINQL